MKTFSVQKAKKIQENIKGRIQEKKLSKKPKYIAAVDTAYPSKNTGIGVSVVIDYDSMNILETSVTRTRIYIPYIPGLLAFRELPSMISAIISLKQKPDLIVVDGHGKAHPRKAGIASHIGVALETPTIGVAKKVLIGKEKCFSEKCYLFSGDERIGIILKEPPGSKKLFISVGHLITLEEAYEIIRFLRRQRGLPFPLDIADKLSKRYAKIESQGM